MDESNFIWQCECGHIEYEDFHPEDCPKCLSIGKFKKVPEDMIEESEAEHILSHNPEEEEDED